MDLPLIDLGVFGLYLLSMVAIGLWYMRKSRTSTGYMVAGGVVPGWAVGLSVFGTYLSSNTFIGVVGQAFGGNWNYFVYSLALPVAAWIGVRYFVPFYRNGDKISAYEHMEQRFGSWARTYCVVCYLLVQFSRIATITFGVSLALNGLIGWSMAGIIIVVGVVTTFYTLLGGMEAVIWTDVVQSFILSLGAFVLVAVILLDMPGGGSEAFAFADTHNKFSLGSFDLSFSDSTFWVVFLFGVFMNVKAFGFDQNYVQRYFTASSKREASKAVWIGALLYIPISMVFFLIGSLLFSYYQAQPDLLTDLKHTSAMSLVDVNAAAAEGLNKEERVASTAATLSIHEVADKALPHFMSNRLPPGVAGLILAAIAAAAMSSISSSYNSSATIMFVDIYKRYWRKDADDKTSTRFLYAATLFCGVFGTAGALAMIGVQSLLAAWWQLTGVFAGAMFGLFLLGLIVRRAQKPAAICAVVVGLLVIIWMVFSPKIHYLSEALRSPFHTNMTVVISTLTMFLVGLLVSRFQKSGT